MTERLVIVGAGQAAFALASKLRALKDERPITIVGSEDAYPYQRPPLSKKYLLGEMSFDRLMFRPEEWYAENNVDMRLSTLVEEIDRSAKTLRMQDGGTLSYDKLIMSPGIDIRWGALEGYDEAVQEAMPHAWKAGPQTTLLRDQLEAMQDGGLVVMSVPPAPFRCPPGPYERASLIANYLKTRKPASKLIILDAKDQFSKQPLFLEAWAKHYPDHLEWIGASDFGRVASVDPGAMTLSTDFDTYDADVANVIPPQKAGEIAERAGVADQTGWCPIDPLDFSSTLQPDIHVLGDATIAAPMPKSAFSANLQAKLCALQITRELRGQPLAPTVLANTCYSYVTPDAAVSITGVYSNEGGALSSIEGAGGLSPQGAAQSVRAAEAAQAAAWFDQITRQTFG